MIILWMRLSGHELRPQFSWHDRMGSEIRNGGEEPALPTERRPRNRWADIAVGGLSRLEHRFPGVPTLFSIDPTTRFRQGRGLQIKAAWAGGCDLTVMRPKGGSGVGSLWATGRKFAALDRGR